MNTHLDELDFLRDYNETCAAAKMLINEDDFAAEQAARIMVRCDRPIGQYMRDGSQSAEDLEWQLCRDEEGFSWKCTTRQYEEVEDDLLDTVSIW